LNATESFAVLRRLTQYGYRVIPQWKVGYYWIDLVVEGGGKRLAIECDGDRFHPIEKLPEDMARQAILERLGWTFSRIRGSQFYRDPDSAMEPILSRLKTMEIPAEGPDYDPKEKEPLHNELKERIIRRAQELRIAWQAGEFADGESGFADNQNGEDYRGGPSTSQDTGKNEHSADTKDNSDPGRAQSPSDGDSDNSTPQGQYREQEDIDWVLSKGVSALRRLHRWAKEFGNFEDLEVKRAYWVAHYISYKKTEKIKPSDARKVKRLWEKALRKGFTES